MSDRTFSSDKPPDLHLCLAAIRSMKADIDVIIRQLKSGRYVSTDTFANNWAHLLRMIEEMKPFLVQPGFADMIVRTDMLLMADLLAITHAVEIVRNFMRFLGNDPRNDQPE
ncbi:hypothetical protein [Pantoea stewartii]|uniref:hypothetical protein n=1 Tax=Pantoea stewartii TaxID=66269 RepID=UPI0025A2DF1D|nr:hypothetical protein [Pantoea stewartii]